jgi:hypothetical protein
MKFGDTIPNYRAFTILFSNAATSAARFSGFSADQRFRAGSLRRIETTCSGSPLSDAHAKPYAQQPNPEPPPSSAASLQTSPA